MCLAIPMKLLEHRGQSGIVEIGGARKEVMLTLTPDAKTDDYLIIHAGYALEILNEQEAEMTIALLQEIGESDS